MSIGSISHPRQYQPSKLTIFIDEILHVLVPSQMNELVGINERTPIVIPPLPATAKAHVAHLRVLAKHIISGPWHDLDIALFDQITKLALIAFTAVIVVKPDMLDTNRP